MNGPAVKGRANRILENVAFITWPKGKNKMAVAVPQGEFYISIDPAGQSSIPYVFRRIQFNPKGRKRISTLCRFAKLNELKEWADHKYGIHKWIESKEV